MGINWKGEAVSSFDEWVNQAVEEVAKYHGDEVQLKGKSLLKFGAADALGTSKDTIWQRGGNETYPSSNAIDKISSSNSGDTQEVKVEGHTIDSDGNFHFIVQTVTLAGQTETALPTPMARANRLYNNGSTDFAGTVYVYEDDTVTAGVPQTTAKIHMQTDGVGNQTLKAATTISNQDYWFLHQFYGDVNEKTAADVDFYLQVRLKGKVFRDVFIASAHSTGSAAILTLEPMIVVPKNSDVRIVGIASTTNVGCSAWINGPLAIVKN